MLRVNHILSLPLRPLILAGALLMLCLSSCSRVQSIREARTIVAEADSLRNAGQSLSPFTFHLSPSQSDSTTIASAVSALEPVRLIYPTDYAHANYYYGRLLREAGNHPEAMLAFLRVVHSRSGDHEIKARSWSNIGTMCNWAEEYALSYDMYYQCAHHFLVCNDSSMYYYALNAMALELAEQHRKDESITILDKIEKESHDNGVLAKIWETRGRLYLIEEQYDSALYCVDILQQKGNYGVTGYITKAQAFSYLGINDSAVYYANIVMNLPDAIYQNIYNVLYILSNNDSTISKEEILSLTSKRADIGVYQLMPQTEQLANAVQLLQMDLNRKPNLTWLWATLATLCIIATSISIYIRKKKAKHQLISQQVEALQQTRDSLSAQTRQIENEQKLRQEKMLAEIELFCNSITEENMKKELCWIDFTQMCTIVNQRMFGLVDKLKARGITSMTEIRICVLLALDRFNAKQMANVVPCTYDSFKTTKSLIVKKLNVSRENIHSYLIKLAVGG